MNTKIFTAEDIADSLGTTKFCYSVGGRAHFTTNSRNWRLSVAEVATTLAACEQTLALFAALPETPFNKRRIAAWTIYSAALQAAQAALTDSGPI